MKKKLIRGSILSILSIIILVAPNVIWFYLNRSIYFTHGATKITTGALISIAFIIALLRGAFADINKKVVAVIKMAITLGILWLFESIISDLFSIVFLGIVGYIGYIITSYFADRDLKKYKIIKDERLRIEARAEASRPEIKLSGRF